MRMHRWTPANRLRLPAALATLLTLPLLACGGGGDGGGDGVTPPQNSAPSASIAAPDDEDNFDEGMEITFQGSGSDDEDGALTGGSLAWESDVDGEIGTGETVSTSGLSQGHHIVTLTATDSEGASATEQIGVRVRPPGENITVDLTIGDNFFEDLQGRQNEDAFVKIRLGDRVRWTYGSNGGATHTVDSGAGPSGDDGSGVPSGGSAMSSGTLSPGDSFTFTPDAEGLWTYFCMVHPSIMFDASFEVLPAP